MKPAFTERFKIKHLLTSENRPLFANFFSLGVIQGANMLLPLITFPYIVRTVGVEHFGLLALLQTIMNYLIVFTDYGFNMSATKDISVNRSSGSGVSKIFSEVIVTKVFLCALSILALLVTVLAIPKLQEHSRLIFFSFMIVVGQVLQPAWFFQGIEKMKYITYITLITKVLYAISIFIFITEASDYIYVNLISGLTGVIGGVLSIFIAINTCKVSFTIPDWVQVKGQLIQGWNIFISSVTITIANNTNILILSLFANAYVIGYYSIAEKIFNILRTFAVVLYQVIYPRVCLLAKESFSHLSPFLMNIIKIVLAAFLPMTVIVFFLSDYIIYFVSGEYIHEASLILKIICFGPFIAALNIPAAQTMLAYQLNKTYALVVSIGAAANVISNLLLAYYFQAIGTAFSILLTETLITALLYLVLSKYYPRYSLFNFATEKR